MLAQKGHPKLIDHNREFRNTPNKKIISCFITDNSDYSEEITATLFGNTKNALFDNISTCICGNPEIEGNFNEGVICPLCHTPVSPICSKDLDLKTWIILPNGIKFIHPLFMEILIRWNKLPVGAKKTKRERGKTNQLTLLDWLFDPRLDIKEIYPELENGYNYVIENFDYIINYLLEHKLNKKKNDDMRIMYESYSKEGILILDKFPLVNESLHIFTSQQDDSVQVNHDKTAPIIRSVYAKLCDIVIAQELGRKIRKRQLEIRYYNIYNDFMRYHYDLSSTKLMKKKGLYRQNLFSARLHYTARAVITPRVTEHYYDQFAIPWKIIVVSYKSVIMNLLEKRYGFTPNEAEVRQREAIFNTFDPIVEEVLHIMLWHWKKLGFKGGPLIANRNPSIRHLALQMGFWDEFTKNNTFKIPSCITPSLNADYDGDHMNIFFIRELDMVKHFVNIHPCTALPSKATPEISDWLRNHSTVYIPVYKWLNESTNKHIIIPAV